MKMILINVILGISIILMPGSIACNLSREEVNIIVKSAAKYWREYLKEALWEKEYFNLSEEDFLNKEILIRDEIKGLNFQNYRFFITEFVYNNPGPICAIAYYLPTKEAFLISAPETAIDKTSWKGKTAKEWFKDGGKELLENIVNKDSFQKLVQSGIKGSIEMDIFEEIVNSYVKLFNVRSIYLGTHYGILEGYRDILPSKEHPILKEYIEMIEPINIKKKEDGYEAHFFTWSQWKGVLIEWMFIINNKGEIDVKILSYNEYVGDSDYVLWSWGTRAMAMPKETLGSTILPLPK